MKHKTSKHENLKNEFKDQSKVACNVLGINQTKKEHLIFETIF